MGRTSNARRRLIVTAHELIWADSYMSVTVEAICDRANVRKGTFYHFFDSKSDLVEAVIKLWWNERKTLMEQVFRQEIKPLERLWRYLDLVAQGQIQAYERNGQIIGAPLFSLASEICKTDERLRLVVEDIINRGLHYFEDAIREAQLSGEARGEDASRTARILWGFYVATLMRARITNNPELIRNLISDARELLDISPVARAPVGARQMNRWPNSGATLDHQTYRRAMEREVHWRATFKENSSMCENSDEMLVLTDVAGRVEWVNETFSQVCGYTLEELRGRKPGQLLQGAESDPAAVALLSDAVHSMYGCDCRIVNYRKDGTAYNVFISLRPVFVHGRIDGFFAVEKALKSEFHS